MLFAEHTPRRRRTRHRFSAVWRQVTRGLTGPAAGGSAMILAGFIDRDTGDGDVIDTGPIGSTSRPPPIAGQDMRARWGSLTGPRVGDFEVAAGVSAPPCCMTSRPSRSKRCDRRA